MPNTQDCNKCNKGDTVHNHAGSFHAGVVKLYFRFWLALCKSTGFIIERSVMVSTVRKVAFIAFAVVALFATGCNSNNKGKIVGKWQAKGAIPLVFEFTADGQFVATALGTTVTKGRYSLGSGDTVNLSDLSPALEGKTRSREKITITGDTMVVAGNKSADMTFTRVGANAPADGK